MIKSFAILALLFATALAQCGSICRFRLCQSVGPVSVKGRILGLRAPKVPAQGPVICLVGDDMGFVRKTGEASLELPSGDTLISKWKPAGLTKKFSKKFFKAGKVKALGRSSPTRGAAKGNQWSFIDEKCVKLPILQYEIRKPTFKIVNTPGGPTDCVSFTTRASQLLIEVTWQSRDDLDLAVTDPNGKTLSRFNKKQGDGRFSIDNAAGVCETKQVAVGKEFARWPQGGFVPKGTYKIVLRHFNNCGAGKTKYQIRATLNGALILNKKGKSKKGGDAIITSINLTI